MTSTIEELGDVDTAIERLVEFYRQNGYERIDDDASIRLQRGSRIAGWWSSAMTRLYSQVIIESDNDRIELRYHIDTTGQWLTDADRAFWDDELAAAIRCATGGELVDLRREERQRAQQVTTDIRRTGIEALLILVVMIVAAVAVAHFFGWL